MRRASWVITASVPTVGTSRAAERLTAPGSLAGGHEVEDTTAMAIRGDAAGQAFALPTDPEPEMGAAASRLDPARARMRRLPDPEPLTQHGPARIIAMCNQKGGVSKTTSTINLGAALVEYGRKVLLIDLDPQGALSVGLGVPAQNLDRTIYNALMERRTSLKDVRVSTDIPGLDLVPSKIGRAHV